MHRSNLTRSERWLERGLGTVVLLALALGLAADLHPADGHQDQPHRAR